MLPPVSLGQGAPASAPAANSKASKTTSGAASFGEIMNGLTTAGGANGTRSPGPSEARAENPGRSQHSEDEDDSGEDAASTRRLRRSTSDDSVNPTQLVSTVIGAVSTPPPASTPVGSRRTRASMGTEVADSIDTGRKSQHPSVEGTKPPLSAVRGGDSGISSAQNKAAKNGSPESLAEALSPIQQPAKGVATSPTAGQGVAPGPKQGSEAENSSGGSMANGPPEAAEKHSLGSHAPGPASFSHGRIREMAGGKPCSGSEADLGTPGAQELAQMKKAEKMSKVAGSVQQNLPEKGGRTVSVAGISAGKEGSSTPLLGSDPLPPAASLNNDSASIRVEHNQAISTSADSARLGSLEHTHDLVAAHALRLRESGGDNLRVVIQPGDGTHLAIELKHANGRIEAQATLQQGDFDHLSRHWADLQQRLESRKIQLSALQHTGQPSAENSSSPHQHKRPSKEEQGGSYTTDFVFGGSMTESPVSRTARRKLNRGWETWA